MRRIPLLVALSLAACASDSDTAPDAGQLGDDAALDAAIDTSADGAPAACVPDPAAWDAGIASLVATHCGTCHGETPAYGAPYPLHGYADWTAQFSATTVAARAVERMAAGTMPPPYASPAPADDLAALIAWASCDPDAAAPDVTPLEVSAPVLQAAAEPPVGATTVDFLAPEWEVRPDARNLYQCFSFDAELDADVFARRIEFVLDEQAVIHHIVLLRDPQRSAPSEPHTCYGMPQGSEYLYAWAPGGGAIDFPDGGLRVMPGERFVLQIHYHNGVGLPDVFDSSGVRLWVTPPEGREYGMAAIGPMGFRIPGGGDHDVIGTCPIGQETTFYASMPHMHTAGLEFEQTIERADGSDELLIRLSGWSFDLQRMYATPQTLRPGDRLVTRCRFRNAGDSPILSGEDTEEEMCFNFAYMTPPPTSRYCDVAAEADTVEYVASACLGDDALAEPATAYVPARLGALPAAEGGPLQPGLYEIVEGELWLSSGTIVGQTVDFDRSHQLVRGQARVGDGEVAFHWVSTIFAHFVEGNSLDQQRSFDFAGPATIDEETGTISVAVECPGEGEAQVRYTTEGDGFVMYGSTTQAGTTFGARYVFAPVGQP